MDLPTSDEFWCQSKYLAITHTWRTAGTRHFDDGSIVFRIWITIGRGGKNFLSLVPFFVAAIMSANMWNRLHQWASEQNKKDA